MNNNDFALLYHIILSIYRYINNETNTLHYYLIHYHFVLKKEPLKAVTSRYKPLNQKKDYKQLSCLSHVSSPANIMNRIIL